MSDKETKDDEEKKGDCLTPAVTSALVLIALIGALVWVVV